MFDAQAAKKAGYGDQEINAYLAQKKVAPGPDRIPGLVKAAVPTGMGILGGLAGSVGGPVGVAGMGALGAMGGQGLINLLERAMGGSAPQTIQQNAESLRNAGGAELLGQGAAGVAGFAANPLRALGGKVTRALADSPAAINLSSLFRDFSENLPPSLGAMAGKAGETTDAVKELYIRLGQMLKSRMPYEGAIDAVPVSIANEIKQQVPKLGNLLSSPAGGTGRFVSDSYGALASPGFEVPKQFTRVLRNEIEQAVPGVKIPNATMHALYQVPEFLGGLSNLLPGHAGRAVRAVGGTIGGIPGKVIPEGGGLLKYLLPYLFQGVQQQAQE